MPNRNLTKEELTIANALLAELRLKLVALSNGDLTLLFAYRRKLAKELGYDERGKPMQRKMLKARKWENRPDSAPSVQNLYLKSTLFWIDLTGWLDTPRKIPGSFTLTATSACKANGDISERCPRLENSISPWHTVTVFSYFCEAECRSTRKPFAGYARSRRISPGRNWCPS
jgi:hypothetical protein